MAFRNMAVFTRWGLGLSTALAIGLGGGAVAQEVVSDMAALNAQASRLDPEDYKFMQPVCTQCHTPAFFLHSRTWSEWQDIFNQMKGYGAEGTPEQWDHIRLFVGRNLTQINVNHADEDELSAVLGVDEKTAIAMVQHRSDHRFNTKEDVESVPGVNKAVIEGMEQRLLFDQLPEDQ